MVRKSPIVVQDPPAYVHSADMRRDITTGQRAMLYACRFPKPKKLKRKSGSPEPDIKKQRISEARKVLEDPLDADLVEAVLAGVTRLDNAVKKAKKAKKREIERSTEAAKLAKLRERYVDLADLVADERAGSRPPELEAFYSWNLSSL